MNPKNASGLEATLVQPNVIFLPQLDFLRSIAVLLVVIDHTAIALGHLMVGKFSFGLLGVIGVWMFFVHTSLVLMWSLERKPYTLDFYIRRIFRIFPLAIFGTLVVLLTHAPVTGYFWYSSGTWANVVGNFLLIYNLFPAAHDFRALLHVEWTLPWELEMYLLLPVLFAFVRRELSLWTMLLIWLLCVQLGYISGVSKLSFMGSVPHFLAGVIAFIGFKTLSAKFPAWTFVPFLAAFIIGASFLLNHLDGPGPWIFSLMLGLGLPLFHSFKQSYFTEACKVVARYSYGIYLAHPFAILFGIKFCHSYPLAVQLLVEAVTIPVLAVSSYHLLEKPMIDRGSRLAAKVEVYSLARRKTPLPTL